MPLGLRVMRLSASNHRMVILNTAGISSPGAPEQAGLRAFSPPNVTIAHARTGYIQAKTHGYLASVSQTQLS
jgi:hypothetical protein